MLILIWGFLILLGFLFPKSKPVSFMMLAYMIIVIGFRTQGADYIIYQNEYEWAEYQIFSDVHYVGYLILEQFAHKAGIQFEQFILYVGLISCILTYSGLRKLTQNVNMLLALYFIYPFAHEAVQTRTFLANSIIIFALPLILLDNENDRKKTIIRRVLFFALATLACAFHFEAIIYVFFIALMLFLPEKYGKMYIIVGTAIAFLLIESGVLPLLVSQLNTRISYWLSYKT